MLFSSSVFLFSFLPAVLILYYGFFRGNRPAQNFCLLLASLFFYAWDEPWFVLVMMGSIAVNYVLGRWAHRRRLRDRPAAPVVWAAAACNLGLLFLFKYLAFAVNTLNALGARLPAPELALPIGISFFTFQALSYVLDVAWGKAEVQRSLAGVGLYISLFPQLIAGPIVKYATVARDLTGRRETWQDFSEGVCRFIAGLGKKVLLANQLALVADAAFDGGGAGLTAPMAWLGAVCYTLQIYYDFSGYSDMAIGLGRMFGFHFLENFNYPYMARSVTEFWHRWHISLSTWFRDYVYIPLGGSRVPSRLLEVRNLFVVWLLTGIWHGANWTFICWGLYYFLLLAAEKFAGLGQGWPVWARRVFTLVMVNFGWVIFRAPSLTAAAEYLSAMFRFAGNAAQTAQTMSVFRENWSVLAISILFSAPVATIFGRRPERACAARFHGAAYVLLLTGVFLASISFLVKGTYNPFIYFNF